jgi:hypothetical protein
MARQYRLSSLGIVWYKLEGVGKVKGIKRGVKKRGNRIFNDEPSYLK